MSLPSNSRSVPIKWKPETITKSWTSNFISIVLQFWTNFLHFAIAILMYVLAIIHLAIPNFWKTEARAIITIPNRLLTKYLLWKLHILVPIFVISGYFFLLSYLSVRKKIVLEIHAGNSSPFCVVMLNSKRYLMLLLYSPYYYTQSVIYFWQTFCQFGHLWMIISAVYRDFHEKKIEFSSSSSSALPFAMDGYFLNNQTKNFPKKILNHEISSLFEFIDYYLWCR